MKRSLPYVLIASCTLFWCASVFLTPLIASIESPSRGISHALYSFFSSVCHQYDSRSFHVFGYKVAVCIRCLSIYLGFLFGILIYPVLRMKHVSHPVRWWMIALLPMIVDVCVDVVGLHSGTSATRMITGSIFGVISSFILLPTMIEGISEQFYQNDQGVLYEPKAR